MKVKLSLGFSVDVDEQGRFELPNRRFNTAELKKITREVNRELRKNLAESNMSEVLLDDE